MKKRIKALISLYCIICIICICFAASSCGTVEKAPAAGEGAAYGETENDAMPTVPEENTYHIYQDQTAESDPSAYGDVEVIHEDFPDQHGAVSFYYDMDCFYFNDTFPPALNETLQAYYHSVQEAYLEDAQFYTTDGAEGNAAVPYDSLLFQYFTYVGDDYVSLVYNHVSYMGGAHPYSALDGITIDCTTGELVPVQQFLDDSDQEIGEQLQAVLGMDSNTLDGWDYYITDTSVVFFYYDPLFWDLVATQRMR